MQKKIKFTKYMNKSTSFNLNGKKSCGHKVPIESLYDNAKKNPAKIFKSEEKKVGHVLSQQHVMASIMTIQKSPQEF